MPRPINIIYLSTYLIFTQFPFPTVQSFSVKYHSAFIINRDHPRTRGEHRLVVYLLFLLPKWYVKTIAYQMKILCIVFSFFIIFFRTHIIPPERNFFQCWSCPISIFFHRIPQAPFLACNRGEDYRQSVVPSTSLFPLWLLYHLSPAYSGL